MTTKIEKTIGSTTFNYGEYGLMIKPYSSAFSIKEKDIPNIVILFVKIYLKYLTKEIKKRIF